MNTLARRLLAAALMLATPMLRAVEIVSNTANSSTSNYILSAPGMAAAQAFTTGPEAMRLSSIKVRLFNANFGDFSTARVRLWSSSLSSTTPTTLVENLGTNNNILPEGDVDYTFNSTTIPTPILAANSRYWVSVENVSGLFRWRNTSNAAFTGVGALVNARADSTNSGGNWAPFGVAANYQILTVAGTYIPQASSTSLSSSVNPSVFGQNVTFTATVTPAAGSVVATGTVEFTIVGSPSILVALNASGIATVSAAASLVGSHTISAAYSGDARLLTSNATLSGGQVVNKANTSTGLSSSQNPSTQGMSVTFTATVSVSAPGWGDPSGTVTFYDGGSGNPALGIGTVSGGQATFTTSSLAAGSHSITATYNGASNFNASTSSTLGQTVNGPVTLSGTLPPTLPGRPYSQSLTAAGGTGVKSMMITSFAAGGTGLSAPTTSADTATLSGTPTAAGTVSFTLTATDTLGAMAAQNYSLTVFPPLIVTTNASSGAGSLAQMLANAALVPGADTITFDPTFFATARTIRPTGETTIGQDLTIDATGIPVGVTLDGQSGNFRFFTVNNGASLTLHGLTLTRGGGSNLSFGGAILNSGTLTLTRCTLSGNRTADGNLGNGGGAIYNFGSLTLTSSTLTANRGGFGGAIANTGSTTSAALTHCTLTMNAATRTEFGGGAIDNFQSAALTLTGCILAGNTSAAAANGPDLFRENDSGPLTVSGCLIGDGTTSTLTHGVNNNQIGTTATPINASLAPLGNYGGPTKTMPPLPGSPAMDAATVVVGLTTDQRGVTRVVDADANGTALPDIGAVELQVRLVTTATDENNGIGDGTSVSLREAIADASGQADIIRFDPNVFNGEPADVIRLTLGTVIKIIRGLSVDARDLSSSVTISGDANGNGTPDTGDTGIFEVDLSGANGANYEQIISLHRLTIKDAYSTNNPGGGILSRGTVTVNQCLLSGNHAAHGAGGGGIFNSGTLTVSQSTITGNHADLLGLGGGGIYNGGTLTINQSTITGNHADNNGGVAGGTGGGGIANDGTLIVNQSTITGNHADNSVGGGGIHSRDADDIIVLTNSLVAGNSITTGTGPDILNSGTPITSSGRTLIGKTDDSSTTWNVNDLTGTSASPLEALLAPLASNGGLTPTVALLPGSPAMNARLTPSEVQRIIVYNSPADSTFTMTFNGQTTAPVVFNASPAVIQSALEALSTVGAGNVIVTGNASFFGSLGNYIVAFRGTLAATDQPALTAQMAVGSPGAVAVFVTTLVEGGSTAVTTDQRGFPIVGTADIGAYEVQGSTVTLTSADNPAVFGQSLTFTATVNELDPQTITPTGTVTFTVDNVPGSPVPLNASGIATFTTSALTAGPHTITATYNGDARLLPSTSNPINQTVLDLTVGNGNDSGAFSLRQALANAAAHPGPDTITLPIGLNGQTLTLVTQLLINDAAGVTIDASGLSNGFTISGGGNVRLFTVAAGSTLTLKNLTLINGKGVGGSLNGAGGAIYNNAGATLSLDGCTLSGHSTNVGGAIFNNGGVLTLTRCAFTGNAANSTGGAIYSVGTGLTAQGCTFSDNTATSSGGALHMSGTASLTNCTFTANAGQSGGGVFNQAGGVLALTHCTLALNSATVSGGGIGNSYGAVTLANCIVAENTAPSGADISNSGSTPFGSATVTRVGVNIVRSHLNNGNTATDSGPAALNADPLLNVLGNYGGPTPTMPLLPGSPALDQTSVLNPALTTDQRGLPRPLGVRPDIGAVEGTVIVVTTPVDELDAPGSLGAGVSLREAVRDVEASGTVAFDRAVFNSTTTNTITLTKGPLNPQRNCTLNGALNPGGIKIAQVPTFTAQPQPQSVASNAPANFAIAVTNLSGGVAYAWRKNGTPNGTTAAALNFANAQEGDEGVYDVVLSEAAAPGTLTLTSVVLAPFAATSQPANLIVDGSAVAIQRHPANAMIALGSSHTLSVVAVGPGTLTYQWTLNGKNISGATKASYLIAKAALAQAGTYRCVVKSGAATAPSDPAEIGVVDMTPKTVDLLASATASFTATVNAAGNGITYAWLKNGGGTAFNAKSFVIKPAAAEHAGLYTCTVTGLAGTFTGGAPTRLTVSNAAPQIVKPLSLPPAVIGQAYFYQIPIANVVGAPVTAFTVGGLPPGMTWDKLTGIISGRPTASTKPLGYPLTIKASNPKSSDSATATLLVNIVPASAVGVFAGPIERSPLNDNLGGRFDLTTTAAGLCSGSITLGARAKLSFTNQLLLSAGVGDVILRANIPGITMADKTPLTAYIEVFATEQLARLTLIHPNGTTLVIPAWRNQWDKTKLASIYAAYYTLRLDPANVGDPPRGYGYASFTVKPDGTLTIAGKLPDGNDVTGGTFVGPEGQILLFNLLYANRGSHVGQFTLTPASPVTSNTVSGSTSWFKPGPLSKITDKLYQAGFGPLNVTAAGGMYVPPLKGLRIMGLLTVPNPNAKLSFTLGGLAPEFNQLLNIVNTSATSLTNTAVITAPATNTTKLPTLTAATGLFAGSFQINGATTALHRPAPFFGQIVKIGATTEGYGYFLLPTATPKISTSPKLSGRVVLGVP